MYSGVGGLSIVVKHHRGSYAVSFISAEELETFNPENSFWVTDNNVAQAWQSILKDKKAFIAPAGEQSKNLRQVETLCNWLAQSGANRSSKLIAFGGGVVGDLVGMVAAIYMRGIELVMVPTTLLSMVDSSVGGKVGVDIASGKNLAGAFWPPSEVLITTETLRTLPKAEFNNGMAEVIKYAAIADPEIVPLFNGLNHENAMPLIQRCIAIKANVVEQDEFEQTGLRATLNFGHTVGHAIEAITDYRQFSHGQAVAIGMVAEARIGELLGVTEPGTALQIRRLCAEFELPTDIPTNLKASDLVPWMRRDKKAVGTNLSMSLLESFGKCKLRQDLNESEVIRGLELP